MRDFELPGRSEALGTRAMAATSHPLATLTALEVLRTGGNAVDAAVAAMALLCVVEPVQTGIGGDCFALLMRRGEGDVIALNGSGWSPQAATVDFMNREASPRSKRKAPTRFRFPVLSHLGRGSSTITAQGSSAPCFSPPSKRQKRAIRLASGLPATGRNRSANCGAIKPPLMVSCFMAQRRSPADPSSTGARCGAAQHRHRRPRLSIGGGLHATWSIVCARSAASTRSMTSRALRRNMSLRSRRLSRLRSVGMPAQRSRHCPCSYGPALEGYDARVLGPQSVARFMSWPRWAGPLMRTVTVLLAIHAPAVCRWRRCFGISMPAALRSRVSSRRCLGRSRAGAASAHRDTAFLAVVDRTAIRSPDQLDLRRLWVRHRLSKSGVLFHNRAGGFVLERGLPTRSGLVNGR